jgi:hypothetical protein
VEEGRKSSEKEQVGGRRAGRGGMKRLRVRPRVALAFAGKKGGHRTEDEW